MHSDVIENTPSPGEFFISSVILASVYSCYSSFLIAPLLNLTIIILQQLHVHLTLGKIGQSLLRLRELTFKWLVEFLKLNGFLNWQITFIIIILVINVSILENLRFVNSLLKPL